LLQQIADTADEEISCSQCLDLTPHYVDMEISGGDIDRLPRLAQHLRQCQVCREEYETLRDLVRLDAEKGASSLDEPRGSD
jgi:hypothetical protein